jgi:hypothetical protein
LNYLYKPKIEFLICGDINTDYLLESNRRKTSSLLTTYNLSHTVDFATRMENESTRAIDNILVDNSRLGSTITLPLICGLSDHDAQLLIINNMYAATKKVSLKQRTRIIKSETLTNFQSLLKQETWQSVYQTQDTNNILNSFLNTFFEASFLFTYRNTKEKNDWITQGIKISCKRKRSLYTLTKNSNDLKAKARYIVYCEILKKVIKETKKAIL